jgi:hypothetical protein
VLRHAKEALVDGFARIQRVSDAQKALVANLLDLQTTRRSRDIQTATSTTQSAYVGEASAVESDADAQV